MSDFSGIDFALKVMFRFLVGSIIFTLIFFVFTLHVLKLI